MSWNNKVVWTEGLFLRPQHFQQHDRYIESLVERRSGTLRSFSWGFTEMRLDEQLLSIGKLGIASAQGVFADGTPFNIPQDDEPPAPLDISEDIRDVVVHLSLPARRPGTLDVHLETEEEGLARMRLREYDVRDAASRTLNTATLQVGSLRTRILLDTDKRSEYTCLGIAHIVEARSDKNVVLKDDFIPPVMDCQATRLLSGFVNELQGLLHHRAVALAGRVSDSGRGGAAEIADFLMLQSINRYEPFVTHLAALGGLHPETLYSQLVQIAGDLATFTNTRRPPEFVPYRHDDLRATFAPVTAALRECLSMVIERNAVPIPLKEKRFGIRVATIADRSLLSDSSFVLAVSADSPTEEIRKRFPAQIKIGPVEQIRELVNVQLPGIQLRPLPVAPRQIPYHSGFVYFELDRSSEYWKKLKDSGGIAMHIGGDYPDLQLEFWAIRS